MRIFRYEHAVIEIKLVLKGCPKSYTIELTRGS